MTNPIIITSREMQRNQKKVFNKVKKTSQPAIVVSHNKKQVAIISLECFDKLQRIVDIDRAKTLLDLADYAEKIGSKGPKDLSKNLDKYVWGAKYYGRKK